MKHYEFPVVPGHYGRGACNPAKIMARVELTRQVGRVGCGNCKRTHAFMRGKIRRNIRRTSRKG